MDASTSPPQDQAEERGARRADDGLMSDLHAVLRRLLDEMPAPSGGSPLSAALREHLGREPHLLAVVSAPVPPHRLVDADIALSEVADADPDASMIGVAGDARHHMSFGDLLQSVHGPSASVGQVDYDRMPTGPGPDDQRQVVTSGIRLFHFDGRPVAVRQQGANPQFGRETGSLEVLSEDRELSDALMARVQALMDERSVIRGQVVTFGSDPYGPALAGVSFVARPTVDAASVVLPPGLLDRVAHHVIGMGVHRERLVAHGQHLKRGVLLYGPPGTGKTHTVRYLLSATPGTTAVLLSGGSLRFIHDAAKVARAHQPAIVVLEDCDLVAEDRSFGMGAAPLLFEVLDALDGLDSDADVAFVLTTNRVEDLEVALSQRPGRVDLAAEIPLPDEDGRLELLRLTAGTSSAPRPSRPLPRAPAARPPPSRRSWSGGPCSRRPWTAYRRPTTTSAQPSTSCSLTRTGSPAACSVSVPDRVPDRAADPRVAVVDVMGDAGRPGVDARPDGAARPLGHDLRRGQLRRSDRWRVDRRRDDRVTLSTSPGSSRVMTATPDA